MRSIIELLGIYKFKWNCWPCLWALLNNRRCDDSRNHELCSLTVGRAYVSSCGPLHFKEEYESVRLRSHCCMRVWRKAFCSSVIDSFFMCRGIYTFERGFFRYWFFRRFLIKRKKRNETFILLSSIALWRYHFKRLAVHSVDSTKNFEKLHPSDSKIPEQSANVLCKHPGSFVIVTFIETFSLRRSQTSLLNTPILTIRDYNSTLIEKRPDFSMCKISLDDSNERSSLN
jgi:hypothetical protein